MYKMLVAVEVAAGCWMAIVLPLCASLYTPTLPLQPHDQFTKNTTLHRLHCNITAPPPPEHRHPVRPSLWSIVFQDLITQLPTYFAYQ